MCKLPLQSCLQGGRARLSPSAVAQGPHCGWAGEDTACIPFLAQVNFWKNTILLQARILVLDSSFWTTNSWCSPPSLPFVPSWQSTFFHSGNWSLLRPNNGPGGTGLKSIHYCYLTSNPPLTETVSSGNRKRSLFYVSFAFLPWLDIVSSCAWAPIREALTNSSFPVADAEVWVAQSPLGLGVTYSFRICLQVLVSRLAIPEHAKIQMPGLTPRGSPCLIGLQYSWGFKASESSPVMSLQPGLTGSSLGGHAWSWWHCWCISSKYHVTKIMVIISRLSRYFQSILVNALSIVNTKIKSFALAAY